VIKVFVLDLDRNVLVNRSLRRKALLFRGMPGIGRKETRPPIFGEVSTDQIGQCGPAAARTVLVVDVQIRKEL
jgi:hypothetical protein